MSESEYISFYDSDDPRRPFLVGKRFALRAGPVVEQEMKQAQVPEDPHTWISGHTFVAGGLGVHFTKAQIKSLWYADPVGARKRNPAVPDMCWSYASLVAARWQGTSSPVGKSAHLFARILEHVQPPELGLAVQEASSKVLRRLKIENQRLKALVTVLTARVRDYQEWTAARKVGQTKLTAQSKYDPLMAAAEMLADSDEEDTEAILSILEKPVSNISDLLERVGAESAVRIANHLGNCHAVIVHDHRLVRTEFGGALAERIHTIAPDETNDGREGTR